MPDLTTAETVEEKMAALIEALDDTANTSRLILRALTEREVVMALAVDSGECYRLTDAAGPLVELGRLVNLRVGEIGTLGRTLDTLCDPAVIPSVR